MLTQVRGGASLSGTVFQALSDAQLLLMVLLGALQVLHAAGSMAQTGIRPHLNSMLLQLLCQLQYSRVIRSSFVKVTPVVVGTAKVAVGACFLTLVALHLGNVQVLFVALYSTGEVSHGDVDGAHIAQFTCLCQLVLALLGQESALLVAS